MSKHRKILFGTVLSVLAQLFPVHAAKNKIMDPSYIFQTTRSGKKATLSRRTTNAAFLQFDGIKGEVKNGRPLVAAVLDRKFYPSYTQELKDKGVIHPAAFKEKLILDPDEKLDSPNYYQSLDSQIFQLEHKPVNNQKEFDQRMKEIKNLKALKKRVHVYLTDFKSSNKTAHGSGVMEAIHLMAPKAQILPIDLLGVSPEIDTHDFDKNLIFGIRKAIEHKVDVINISQGVNKLSEDLIQVFKEATDRGIAIIYSAGNESSKTVARKLDEIWDKVKGLFVRNPKMDLFDRLKGKGIRFAGAVKYTKTGEEKVTSYTTHPTQSSEKHFIFAPGNKLPIHAKLNPDELVDGTSFAAPTVTGGYLLLKEHVLEQGYSLSTERLLEIMHDSGRDVSYRGMAFWNEKIYKSMDVYEAKLLIDKLEKEKAAKLAPKPAPLVVKKVVSKPALAPVVVQKVAAPSIPKAVTPAKPAPKSAPKPPPKVAASKPAPKPTPAVKKAAPKTTSKQATPVKRSGVKTKAAPARRGSVKSAAKRTPAKRAPTKTRAKATSTPKRRGAIKATPSRKGSVKSSARKVAVKKSVGKRSPARKAPSRPVRAKRKR